MTQRPSGVLVAVALAVSTTLTVAASAAQARPGQTTTTQPPGTDPIPISAADTYLPEDPPPPPDPDPVEDDPPPDEEDQPDPFYISTGSEPLCADAPFGVEGWTGYNFYQTGTIADPATNDLERYPPLNERTSPDQVLRIGQCVAGSTGQGTDGYEFSPPVGIWGDVAEDPELDIAEDLYAEVLDLLEPPAVEIWPEDGTAAIVKWPTFVAVTNWDDLEIEESQTNGSLTVTITATPSMVFDPGDGTDPVECNGPGVIYTYETVEEGRALAEQDDTCSHTYLRRTGIPGRLPAWPGRLIVTWEIEWTSTTGRGEEYPPESLYAPIDREVDEIQVILQ